MADNREKTVEVKDLTISFRTNNGTVKAVRNINFDLYKGETLAIVGESGSGKSVTSRAIMGILANNKIVEDGEILFEGNDLLKTSEEDYVKIRGAKIAMIFQDPMSSLNPIMHVGQQITESTILKSKADVKEANLYLKKIQSIALEGLKGTENEKEKIDTLNKYIDVTNKYYLVKFDYDYAKYYAKKASEKFDALNSLLDLNSLTNNNFYIAASNFLTFYGAAFEKNVISKAASEKDEIVTASLKYLGKKAKLLANKYSNTYVAWQELEAITTQADLGKVEVSEIKDEIRSLLVILKNALDEFFAKPELDLREDLYKNIYGTESNGNLEKGLDEFKSKTSSYLAEAIKNLNVKYNELTKTTLQAAKDFAQISAIDKTSAKTLKNLEKTYKQNINPVLYFDNGISSSYFASASGYISRYFEAVEANKKEDERVEKAFAKAQNAYAKNGGEEPVKETPSYRNAEKNYTELVKLTNKFVEDLENVVSGKKDAQFNEVFLMEQLNKYSLQKVSVYDKARAKDRALELMREVGIPFPEKRFDQYPFQFSGGMRQRIVIAIAIASNPKVLICDEPTTALDVTIQAQILELINRLKVERQLSIIFITHDLGVVANMADRIAVMYAGKIVETGLADEIFYEPRHPYTWALLAAMPDINSNEKLDSIPGTPPNMLFPPKGDAFAARNKYAMKIDFEKQPPFFKVSDTHYAATWLLHPNAPKVYPPKIVTERIKNMRSLAEADYKESGNNIVDFENDSILEK